MAENIKMKVGVKGKILNSQSREIISNVIQFMKNEAQMVRNNQPTIPVENFRARVLAATGISKPTYEKITKATKNITEGVSSGFTSPRKKRPRNDTKINLCHGELTTIRDIVRNFYIIERRRPCLKSIQEKLRESGLSYSGNLTTTWKLLRKLGFKWKKTEDNRKALMESHDIRIKRIEYLKKIKYYRDNGWNIVYTDETYLHSSHTQPCDWNDGSENLKKPISKGKRLIIVHAGGEQGFVENGLLIFQSGTKSGDYHDEMNSENFLKWVGNQLLPNLPQKSVLVVDNASYHNVQINKAPTSGSKKKDMIDWLTDKNIHFNPNALKPELYELIKRNKDKAIKFRLDSIMEDKGHKVLRLPPYHPDLNPIEKIWASLKNWVATHNTTFKLQDVERLARSKFMNISVDDWLNVCNHVKKVEDQFIENEHIFDNTIELIINLADSTDEDDSTDDELSEVETLEDDEVI